MECKCDKCPFIAKSEFGLRLHIQSKHKPEEAPQPVINVPDLITINLKHYITINGKGYGGAVSVPPSLAQDLQYRDDMVSRREEREKQSFERNIYLGDIR